MWLVQFRNIGKSVLKTSFRWQKVLYFKSYLCFIVFSMIALECGRQEQALSSGWWLQRAKDHREDEWEKKRDGNRKVRRITRIQRSGKSNGSTWFRFELSVFCHVGESVSHKVMYNTPLITFWPPRTPHCAFPPSLPSPSISMLYARGVETQASKETIQPGFQFSQAFTKASGNSPDLPGRSETLGWVAALEAWALTTQLNANRNHAIYWPFFSPRVRLEMWRDPK